MMDAPDISDSEWLLMEWLWDQSPGTAPEIAAGLRGRTGWAENTVRTMLTRLVAKQAVAVETGESGKKEFRPAVLREQCVRAESRSFLKRVFRGSARPLLAHFVENSQLTAAEVKELKRLLDQSLKHNPPTPPTHES